MWIHETTIADRLTMFTYGMIRCALWSNSEENEEDNQEVQSYTPDNFDDNSLFTLRAEANAFYTLATAKGYLNDWEDKEIERAGALFWLNRNGHGTGFWDEEGKQYSEELSELAHEFGEKDILLSDPDENGERTIFCFPLEMSKILF